MSDVKKERGDPEMAAVTWFALSVNTMKNSSSVLMISMA